MSGSLAKAERRALRRAVGDEAVSVMETERERVDALVAVINAFVEERKQLKASRWARLRWIVGL